MEQTGIERNSIDDDWRRWIAENLALNGDPQGLYDVMVAKGIAETEAARELELALASPYLLGARQANERLKNRLKKRDWILDIHRTLNRQSPDSGVIERRHRLPRTEFYRSYYFNNKPVIITGMLQDWAAMTRWNSQYFRERLGDREIQVQFGRSADTKYEINSAQLRKTMKMRDYVYMIENVGTTNDFYMTANNNSMNRVALAELWEDIGRLPEYLDLQSPDDGFLWYGPAGTKTPFHHDLTNNFMAQVLGRKRIKLIPSCELPYVYNDIHCYTPVDGDEIDYDQYPLMRNVQLLDCELNPGEILFLPVGCWHYVEALDASVTLSFINFQCDNNYARFYSTYHEV